MTRRYLPHGCPEMCRFVEDERVPVVYEPKFREYSLALRESDAHQLIGFCPWCGVELPDSLRDRFFDELEKLGIDYPDQTPPRQYNTDAWWREDGHQSVSDVS